MILGEYEKTFSVWRVAYIKMLRIIGQKSSFITCFLPTHFHRFMPVKI